MFRQLLLGTAAGAAGTVALDLTSTADVLLRGRGSSDVPAQVASRLAGYLGLASLREQQPESLVSDEAKQDDAVRKNRQGGAGAMLGYGNGLGAALVYALVRPLTRRWLPAPVAGLMLGMALMAAGDGLAVGLGVTDPKKWGFSGWLADLIPHAMFGLTTATVLEALVKGDRTR